MNKKILLMGALAIALAVAGGYGVKASMNNDVQLGDLAKANIEALAGWEAPGDDDDGYTKRESNSYDVVNGVVVWELERVICTPGGPNPSCTDSCRTRTNGGRWSSC